MKRWLLLITAIACLWGCSDETPKNTNSTSSASSGAGGNGSSSSGNGGAGGEQPAALVTCLDEMDALPRPPSGKLPCEYIPPDLKLAP
jgi:hypothetical protein